MKKPKMLLSILLALLLVTALPITAFADDVDTTVVNDAYIVSDDAELADSGAVDDLAESGGHAIVAVFIDNVVPPIAGEYPSYTATISTADQTLYKKYDQDTAYLKNGVFWYNATDERSIAVNSERFVTGKQYMVRVLLTPCNDSDYFSSSQGHINDKAATVVKYADDLIGVEYTFTCGPISGTTGDCTWSFNGKNNTLTISGSGNMADYSPSDLPWKEYLDQVKRADIGSGVKNIGEAVFANTGLVTITIPDSVTQIGQGAFWLCESLTYATLGNNLKTIGEMAFRQSGLTTVTIPNNVETIAQEAFEDCTSLIDAQIGTKVKTIGDFAFYQTALTSVTIPDSVQTIGYRAFANCRVQGDDGAWTLGSVNLGVGLKKVEAQAFLNAALTEVKIPSNVTYIGEKAFGYTYNAATETYSKISGFTIKGMTGSAAETYAKNNGFTFVSLDKTYTISGDFTSYLNSRDVVTFQLLQNNTVKYSTTKTGNTGSYSISNIAAGAYTLRVTKKNHTTRDYSMTVLSNMLIYVKINPIGDVNLNGKVDIRDVNTLYNHTNESPLITEKYSLKCADVAKKFGEVNIRDVNALYNHVMETVPLY